MKVAKTVMAPDTALSSKTVHLRAMRPQDLPSVAKIYLTTRQAFFPWVKAPQFADFERVSVGERIQVAVVDQEIVGFAALSEWDSFLHLLFVKVGWQSQGIGGQLLAWAQARAQQPLELKVVQANVAAQRFYERAGFRVVARDATAQPQNVTYRDDRNC
ncbi:GNAT family N-acetyltransferase [Leuconostoc holzapfelii]|nr:GNAT family N-acetyltransferase [Leuconostoc holzapfelii]